MDSVLDTTAPHLSDDVVRHLLATHWSIDAGDLHPLPSERDLNVLVDDRFVLKVSNPAERADLLHLEEVSLAHLQRIAPDLPVPRLVQAGAAPVVTVQDTAGRACLARLITVVPGAPLEGSPITLDLAEQVGAVAARTSVALRGLFHHAADRVLDWDVRRAPEVLGRPGVLAGLGEQGQILGPWLERLAVAATATRSLPSGLQHADVTLTNVLVTAGVVTGLIDLGDMHHTAAVCDLAVTLTSVLRNTATVQHHDVWELTAATLLGYQRHRLLERAEVEVLGDLVVARLGLTLAIAARRVVTEVDNADYIGQYDDRTRTVLAEWCHDGPEVLTDRLHRMAGTHRSAGGPDLLGRRHAAMGGPLAPLFYTEPLSIVRGEGPWLIGADGTRYLDAYNNVAVVGHAHPTITQAVSRQLGTLNTHSRYLHPTIVELAERLLGTVPDEIDTCLFTTSGTEANELAWRLATAHTGRAGAVIAEHAYHGSSAWMADLSSNEWPVGHRPDHVATFAAPRPGDRPRPHHRRCRRPDSSRRPSRARPGRHRLHQRGDPRRPSSVPGRARGGCPRLWRPLPGRRGPVRLRPQRSPAVALRGRRDHPGRGDPRQADGRGVSHRRGPDPP